MSNLRSLLLLSMFIFASLAQNIFADSFVVNTPSIQQNGGNTIDGDDTLTITEDGSITVNGIDAVSASGTNNTINNNGTLTTTGNNSIGIDTGGNTTILNSGSIQTSGDSSPGIRTTSNSLVTNSGSISTNGIGSTGIVCTSNTTITNTGTINTNGLNADGVFVFSSSTVNNKGTIISSGTNSEGMIGSSNNTFTNSGKVISNDSFSIRFILSGNTLNLVAPSFLGGEIDLGNTTTVNITTGPSHSVLWDFSTGALNGSLNVNGPVPYFYNITTQQFATFDPTALSTMPDYLADVSGAAMQAVDNRLARVHLCGCSPCSQSLWLSFGGSRFEYKKNSALLKRDVSYWNFLIGADKCVCLDVTAGIFAGYGRGFLEADSSFYHSFNNNADGFVGGAYMSKSFDCYYTNFKLAGGNLHYSDKRYVNNNLAISGEGATAKACHGSWWISPELLFGADFYCWCDALFMPSISYRYAYQHLSSYHEYGATANATVASANIQVGELKLEALVQKQLKVFTFGMKGGYLLRNPIGKNDTKVTLIDETEIIPCFSEDRSIGFVGGNLVFCLGTCCELIGEAEYTIGTKMNGFSGSVNLNVTF